MAGGSSGLAFVSIDGPPKGTFDKLVANLSTEAETRQVKVASRDDPSAYRVKGYLSMHMERGKGSVAYAWDIYDADKVRVARITGEEQLGKIKGSSGWAACNDAVIARIADRSMAELAETFGGNATPAPAASSDVAQAQAPARDPAASDHAASGNVAAAAGSRGSPGTPRVAGTPVADAGNLGPALAYTTN